jgi:hypothetical protein
MLRQRLARELPDGPEPAPEIVAGPLPMLDDAAFALAESFSGHRHRFHLSCPNVWAGWDLPPELVEALFRAAAGFYRTTPWDVLGNLDAFEAATAAGRRWTVSVLGAAGEVFGLNLFSDSADLWRLSERDQETAFDDLAGQVIALHFLSGQEVGRAMVREATAAGWEVADARGYPMLYTMSSPAGGLRRHDAEDLLAILGAIPRFLEHQARAVEESRPVGWWRDEPTGVELSYEPEGDVDIGPVWMPEHLDPGGAEGPGADPEAAVTEARRLAEDPDAFHDREPRFVGRFARPPAGVGDRASSGARREEPGGSDPRRAPSARPEARAGGREATSEAGAEEREEATEALRSHGARMSGPPGRPEPIRVSSATACGGWRETPRTHGSRSSVRSMGRSSPGLEQRELRRQPADSVTGSPCGGP